MRRLVFALLPLMPLTLPLEAWGDTKLRIMTFNAEWLVNKNSDFLDNPWKTKQRIALHIEQTAAVIAALQPRHCQSG